jgi:hypothetical protein
MPTTTTPCKLFFTRLFVEAVDVVAATVEELYLPGLLDALVTRNEKVSISGL